MEVILNNHTFLLTEHQVSCCKYFQDLKETKIDLTELTLGKAKITADEFREFGRLLDDRSHDLPPERLAFFATYFFCDKAAKELVKDKKFKDLDWRLEFIRNSPISEFLIPDTAEALIPFLVAGTKQLENIPSTVSRHLAKPLLSVLQEVMKSRCIPPERRFQQWQRRQQILPEQMRTWEILSVAEKQTWISKHRGVVHFTVEMLQTSLKPPPQESQETKSVQMPQKKKMRTD